MRRAASCRAAFFKATASETHCAQAMLIRGGAHEGAIHVLDMIGKAMALGGGGAIPASSFLVRASSLVHTNPS